MLHRLWKHLKVARRLNFGPASVVFRFERAVRLRTAPRNLPAVENQAPVTELAHARAGPLGAERGTVSQSVSAKPEPETALIVGAGPGLGESLARRLASEGINIALASRDGVRLERLAGELRRGGVRASGFTCDVTDRARSTFVRGTSVSGNTADGGLPRRRSRSLPTAAARRVLLGKAVDQEHRL
jgi:predicted amino acid dehydrogenase